MCRISAAEVEDETGKQVFVEVFVGGLPSDASDEGVEAAFAAVGEVLSVRLNRRKKTGECKGFGFIRYADQETAERACAEVKEVSSTASHFVPVRGNTALESFLWRLGTCFSTCACLWDRLLTTSGPYEAADA